MDALAFSFPPLGFVRSPYAKRIDAPHQPTVVEGTESGPCDPLANHGYFGREATVVQAIRNWILGLPYEREIP